MTNDKHITHTLTQHAYTQLGSYDTYTFRIRVRVACEMPLPEVMDVLIFVFYFC